MIFFILYLAIDGDYSTQHPYHFATSETCVQVGKTMLKYGYENYRCVKETI